MLVFCLKCSGGGITLNGQKRWSEGYPGTEICNKQVKKQQKLKKEKFQQHTSVQSVHSAIYLQCRKKNGLCSNSPTSRHPFIPL